MRSHFYKKNYVEIMKEPEKLALVGNFLNCLLAFEKAEILIFFTKVNFIKITYFHEPNLL